MPSKSAKKTAKKAVKKPRHPKKTKIPELITVGYSPKREFHVLFSDGATHIFKGESLDPTLHKQFIGHQADVLKGKLMIPYRGNTLQFTARELDDIRNPPDNKNGKVSFLIDDRKFERIMNIYGNFKNWFERHLKKRKMNQSDVCKATGLSSATMSWLATGKTKPEFSSLLKIMKAFKIDINKL
jgi:DNA-binding Xre family transcriptional regulator